MSTNTPVFSPSVKLASELLGARLKPEPAPKKRKYTVTNKATRGEQLKKHQWKKGQSGNPKGRPVKNLSLVSLVKERLENHPEEAREIAIALISMAKNKEMRAIEELLNRIDGKVAETHKIEGELPITLRFVPAQVLLEERRIDKLNEAYDQLEIEERGEIIEGEAKELPEGG